MLEHCPPPLSSQRGTVPCREFGSVAAGGAYFLLKRSIAFTRVFSRALGGGQLPWREAIRTEEGG